MRSARFWPAGTGQWKRIHTLVISEHEEDRARLAARDDAAFVATPLDLIVMLENEHNLIDTVVLAGEFAHDHDLAVALHELYPRVGIREGAANATSHMTQGDLVRC